MRARVLVLVVGCGRIGFDAGTDGGARPSGDGGVAPWSHLVAYANQTCAVLGGLAYCWGRNAEGELGNGTMTDAPRPTQVALPSGTVNDLAEGESHGCAVVDGALYCYGASTNTLNPKLISLAGGGGQLPPASAVTIGRGFTCVVAAGVYCWGANNAQGQLCLGDTNPRTMPTATLLPPSVTAIHGGDDHTCALGPAGPVCWGHNDLGTLGDGKTEVMQGASALPVAVGGGVTALPLIAGWHACALQAGSVFCWGEGDNGELGDGGNTSTPTPQLVPGLTNVTALATGGGPNDRDATCAIVAGAVNCWGNGYYGRLGQGVAISSSVPIAVNGLPGPAVDVAIGDDHACALLGDGDIWCWGRGGSGQLGDGLSQNSLAPVRVVKP